MQTVYRNLKMILEPTGATVANVIKETIFTTDMNAFLPAVNIRKDLHANGLPPATTGVTVAGLAHPEILIEIEAIAAL